MDGPGAVSKWQTIHRSEHIKNDLNPKWEPVSVSLKLLCRRDLDRPIQVSIFGKKEDGKHQNMGSFETTGKMYLLLSAEVDTANTQ